MAKLCAALDRMLPWLRRRCTRNCAKSATANIFPDEADAAVDRVFEKAFQDTSPLPASPSSTSLAGRAYSTIASVFR
eukprot:scaffold553_cov238-Pinguiococcus_pyrenoidosus.AAC.1